MTIAVDLGRKATKTNKQTLPGNRMIRRAKISDRHDEVLNSAHDVCVN